MPHEHAPLKSSSPSATPLDDWVEGICGDRHYFKEGGQIGSTETCFGHGGGRYSVLLHPNGQLRRMRWHASEAQARKVVEDAARAPRWWQRLGLFLARVLWALFRCVDWFVQAHWRGRYLNCQLALESARASIVEFGPSPARKRTLYRRKEERLAMRLLLEEKDIPLPQRREVFERIAGEPSEERILENLRLKHPERRHGD